MIRVKVSTIEFAWWRTPMYDLTLTYDPKRYLGQI